MRRDVVPWLKVATCGVVMCGYLALLATLMYPPTILAPVVLAIAAMPLGEQLHREREWYSQVTTGISIVALLGILLTGPELGALNTVIGLMMLVQVHALVHVKRQRHYSYLVLMAFSQVMAASMMSPSPEIGLVYVLLIVFTIWTLVLLDIFRGTEEQGEVYVHGSVDFEARNGGVRESGGRAFRRSLIAWISALAVATVALSAGLFFVIPRTQAGAFGAQDIFPVQEDYTTGLSSAIDLRAAGRITEDPTALMNARFPELPDGRFNGPMYWRVTTFDKYSGEGWTRQGLESKSLVLFRRAARFAAHPESTRGSDEGVYRADYSAKNTVEFEVFLTEMPEEGVPVLSLPLMVQPQNENPGLWAWDAAGDFTVHHLHRGESGISYRGVSVVGDATPAQLRNSREDYLNLMKRSDYTLLTEQNLLPETLRLVQQITANANTAYDKLDAIQQYLSTDEFRYSLDVPELPPNHPMDAFILDVRTGHCQLFASAMALMARSQGIPARLVSGYRGGTYDDSSQSYTVAANMAHVWVEVFFPDFGWTIFDPSPPPDAPVGFSFQNFRSAYSTFALKLKLFWLRRVVGYNAAERSTSLGALADKEKDQGAAEAQPERRRVAVVRAVADHLQMFVFGLVLLTVAICFALFIRSAIRSRRGLAGLADSQVRAVALYRLLQRRLGRLGIVYEGKVAEELVSAASELDKPLGTTVERVVEAYNATRFGTRTLAPEDFARLKRQVRALRLQPD